MFQKNKFRVLYAISFAWQLGFLVAIPIAGFILLGLWGDKVFKTHPFLLIAGALIGVAVTVYEVYHFLLSIIGNKNDSH